MTGPEGSGGAPLVSVVIPVRNGAAHLDEALASMVGQTLRDMEIVVVDDGSTDDTPDVLAGWSERDARVRATRQKAEGIVPALERGRALARGAFIARMDADDVSEPDRLQAQLDLLERRPELSGCGCGVRYFPDELVRDGARRYEGWINDLVAPEEIDAGIFVECPLPHPTFFFRADALASVGGYRLTNGPEDYELLLRMWAQGHRFGKVPDVLLRWREGEGRLSRTDPRYAPEAFLATKVTYLCRTLLATPSRRAHEAGAFHAPRPALRPVVIWGAGPVGKGLSRALQDAGVELTAFVELDRRKIGQEIHGAPVVDTSAGLALGPRGRAGPAPLHLAAVGQEGARRRITELLEGAGMRPLDDFVAMA